MNSLRLCKLKLSLGWQEIAVRHLVEYKQRVVIESCWAKSRGLNYPDFAHKVFELTHYFNHTLYIKAHIQVISDIDDSNIKMQPTPAPTSAPNSPNPEPEPLVEQPTDTAPPPNVDSAPFGILVALFEKLQDERKHERRRRLISTWFTVWVDLPLHCVLQLSADIY